MTSKLDYIAGAIISHIQEKKLTAGLESDDDIWRIFHNAYGRELSDPQMQLLVKRLAKLGFIKVYRDEYAGTFYTAAYGISLGTRAGMVPDKAEFSIFKKAISEGGPLLRRVFENPKFWEDLEIEIDENADEATANDSEIVTDIPASDRVVTLTHNQQVELEVQTTEIIEAVEKQNQIDGDPSLRSKILGQLKAGLELIRASIFDAQLMYLTLVETLKWLVARYDQAVIGSLAGTLLVELAKINGFLN